MRRTSIILILFFVGLVSCKQNKQEKEHTTSEKLEFTKIIKDDYELYKPNKEAKAVLILFGGYPETAEDIKREFKILDIARKNNIAVLLSNFNQKLWLEEDEKQKLAEQLQNIFLDYKLPKDAIYIGGFSSGGNVSLLISSFLIESNNFLIKPSGVFIADSPIDLIGLYRSSEKNIKRNFSEVSVTESNWIIEHLEENFGNPTKNIVNYENSAVFTSQTNAINNLKSLKNIKIRLYTEPDTIWWRENRMEDYDQTNAYYIKRLSETLEKSGFDKVEYIPTENMGFRANGERHPHSWSIVDKNDLMNWILTK
jgi:hypothetical protein